VCLIFGEAIELLEFVKIRQILNVGEKTAGVVALIWQIARSI
jgi:hypothetical protein